MREALRVLSEFAGAGASRLKSLVLKSQLRTRSLLLCLMTSH